METINETYEKIRQNPEQINYIENETLRNAVIKHRYFLLEWLNQNFLTGELFMYFFSGNKNLVDCGFAKLLTLKKFITKDLFVNIVQKLSCDNILFLMQTISEYKTDDFSTQDLYSILTDKYYDIFMHLCPNQKCAYQAIYKYNKHIHEGLKSGVYPQKCLLKLVHINKFYLIDVDIDYNLQKELIRMKPNLIKYIKNASKDLIIFAIKRCFKLIYYVSDIDKEIFMEFVKSHNPMRVRKFYIWCKEFDYETPTGRFRTFDFKGFIKEYEENITILVRP